MMNPENVGRHDVHAAGLHLEQFIAPLGLRHARVVHFAHHRKHRLAVEQQAAAVQGDFVAGGICGRAEFEIARFGGLRRLDRGRNDIGAERNGKHQARGGGGKQQLCEMGIHFPQITRMTRI